MRREQQNTEATAHVNDEGRPLCGQDGNYFHLCEPDEFEGLPKECRCQLCEQLFRHCFNASNSKQHLLTMISRKTLNQDSWCPITDLCKKQTKNELTSLSRSLRQLELEGLIEMKTNHNQTLVRLSNKDTSNKYLIDVYRVDC